MGFFGRMMEKGRGLRLKADWKKVEPVVSAISSSASRDAFYIRLHSKYKVASKYADNMTTKGRIDYGMQLQIDGLRKIDLDMTDGAATYIVGAYIESTSVNTPDCQDVAELMGQFINVALSSREE